MSGCVRVKVSECVRIRFEEGDAYVHGVCVCVHVYVCLCVHGECMHVCIYACMYVCMCIFK